MRAGVLRDSYALTMTGLYNARARIGLGDPVSDAERAIYDQGRVGIIDHLHQRLDQLVAKAYGWPDDLADSQIVERLLQMNQARAEQEEQGDIRFLRPAYQAGKVRQGVASPAQPLLPTSKEKALLPEQPGVLASSLLSILRRQGVPMSPTELIDEFEGSRPRAKRLIIHTLKVLAVAGSVQMTDTGWFAPRRMPS